MITTNSRSVASPDLSIRRVRYPLEMRPVRVVRSEAINPFAQRITFAGERLHHFEGGAFDDHVKLVLPLDRSVKLVLPTIGPEGPVFPPDAPPTIRRDYTPRRVDRSRGEMDIEFDLRSGGPAATWARTASVGDEAGIGGPRGSFLVPDGFSWQLYIGDETAIPAITRRLEELPPGTRVFVVATAATASGRRNLKASTRADLTLEWCETDEELLHVVSRLPLPARPGYAWAGGEASTMRAVRNVLRDEHGLPAAHTRVTAYWKHGVPGHHEAVV